MFSGLGIKFFTEMVVNLDIINTQGVQEADRPDQGFYIRLGITIILEKATINDGTVI